MARSQAPLRACAHAHAPTLALAEARSPPWGAGARGSSCKPACAFPEREAAAADRHLHAHGDAGYSGIPVLPKSPGMPMSSPRAAPPAPVNTGRSAGHTGLPGVQGFPGSCRAGQMARGEWAALGESVGEGRRPLQEVTRTGGHRHTQADTEGMLMFCIFLQNALCLPGQTPK